MGNDPSAKKARVVSKSFGSGIGVMRNDETFSGILRVLRRRAKAKVRVDKKLVSPFRKKTPL